MENYPHIPQGGHFQNPWQGVNPYGTDDPAIQASIEQARTEASQERRRNRERLERYVEAGLAADDAEVVVEFEQAAHDQQVRTASPPPERLTDEELIHLHITEALREDRPIDHATVRAIASQLHGGQASPLYALASSGALVDGLTAELDAWRADNQTGVEVEPWLDALDEYLASRDDPGRVEGWAALWPRQPPAPEAAAEDDETVAAALLDRLNTAAVTTLGQVATVVGGLVEQPDESPEGDDFSWVDAAEWRPAHIALSTYDERRYPAGELDEVFAEPPDEQVGTADELGWYGLVKHQDKPGGLILIQDEQGFRCVRDVPTDDALAIQWAAIQAEYEDFYSQRDAYELATEEATGSPSGLNPRIWVGSLADYNAGRLHGVWLDATLDPDELYQAIQFMLRNGYTPGAEEWGIFDHDEFGGFEVSEYADLKMVSRVAQGVAEHGPPYAAWVELVGADSEELLSEESFRDHYEGEFESAEDYVEYILQETDFYRQLDEALAGIPEDLRRYITVDAAGIAEEWAQGLHVVETSGGRVWVFDGRA